MNCDGYDFLFPLLSLFFFVDPWQDDVLILMGSSPLHGGMGIDQAQGIDFHMHNFLFSNKLVSNSFALSPGCVAMVYMNCCSCAGELLCFCPVARRVQQCKRSHGHACLMKRGILLFHRLWLFHKCCIGTAMNDVVVAGFKTDPTYYRAAERLRQS